MAGAPHHITIRNSTVRPIATATQARPHSILQLRRRRGLTRPRSDNFFFDDFDGKGVGGLASTSPHSDATNKERLERPPSATRVSLANWAFMLWDPTLPMKRLVEDTTITGATRIAVREGEGSRITLHRVTSTGSGEQGFFSRKGSKPPEVASVPTPFCH